MVLFLRWSHLPGLVQKFFNTEFYTCPCTSQRHQWSAVPTCTRGRNWQRPCQAELVNVMIARSGCLRRKSWTIKKYFLPNLTHVVAIPRLNRHFGPTSSVRNSPCIPWSESAFVCIDCLTSIVFPPKFIASFNSCRSTEAVPSRTTWPAPARHILRCVAKNLTVSTYFSVSFSSSGESTESKI